MKTTVEIYDDSIASSCLFKGKIKKIINEELNDYGYENAELIELIYVGMYKEGGYGQYFLIVELAVNNFEWEIIQHSTDSLLFDKLYNDDTKDQTISNTLKSITLSMLKGGVERLVDELIDHEKVVRMKTVKS